MFGQTTQPERPTSFIVCWTALRKVEVAPGSSLVPSCITTTGGRLPMRRRIATPCGAWREIATDWLTLQPPSARGR